MTSPGGVEVGRVSIRVVPDTSKFARELRRKLQQLEKSEKLTIPVQFEADREQLQRELEKLRVRAIEVPVEPDFTGFNRELNNRLRTVKPTPIKVPAEPNLTGFRTQLNNELRAIQPSALKVPAEPDLTGFRAKLNAAVRAVVPTPVKVGAEPDLTGFRAQLRAQLAATQQRVTVGVDLNPNITDFRNRVRGITGLNVRVDLNPNITQLRAALRGVTAPNVPVTLNPNITDFRARLRAINAQVRVDLVPNILKFRAALKAIKNPTVSINVDVNEALIAARVAAAIQVGARLGSLGLGGTISQGVGSGINFGAFANLARTLGTIVGYLIAASAISFALAVAGAAITAAYGAVATAIAAIPGLLLGIAPAVATVILGMDGIKEAAKTLKPEFDSLKKAVNDTFKKGFTDAFKIIKPLFPTIQGGMVGIAKSINEVAINLAKFLKEAQAAGLIETVFNRISGAILALSPAINDIVFSLLRIAGVKELWDGVTLAIQRFGESFKTNVTDLLKENTLQTAFKGLGEVLGSLAVAFSDLVRNGIEVFSTAWPGVQKFIDDLTRFFNQFDWKALGNDVSNVFIGLGDALNKVPPGTIEAIQKAFADLGATFRDQNFQQNLANMVAGIPLAITAINNLMSTFARFGSASVGLLTVMNGIGKAFSAFADLLAHPIEAITSGRFLAAFQEAQIDIAIGGKMLQDSIKGIGPGLATAANSLPSYVVEPLKGIPGAFTTLNPLIAKEVEALGGRSAVAAERAMQDTVQGAQAGLQPLPGAVQQGVAPAAAAVGTGLEPAAASAQTALDQVTAAVDTSIGGLGLRVTTAMSNVKTALGNSTREWAPAVKSGMDEVKVAMDTGFSLLVTSAYTGLQGVTDRINTSTPQWAAAIGLGMNTVVNNFTLAFTNIQLAVDTGMIGVQTSFTNGLNLINTTIVAQTAVWAANISLGFNTISNTVTLGMGLIVTAVQLGMTNVSLAFTTGLTAINTTLVTQSAIWAATLSLAMNTLLNTVVLGFSNIVSQVQIGLTNTTTAFTTGWSTINTGLTTAMTTATETVRTGMTNMTAAARDGMINITTEFTNGSNRVLQILDRMISSAVSKLNAAVPKFRTAGANMGQALADGLNSKAGEVEAAAQRLANAAAAAMRAAAEINSPSKVTMSIGESLGEGLSDGMDNSHTMVKRAADRLVNEIETHLANVANSATEIGAQIELTPTVNSASVMNSGALAGVGTGGVDITTNIYNPLPETGSDSVAKTARRQARLGLFG